jgi:DNA-binding NarL/FixJ family response regulator
MSTRILIADDHAILRQGVQALLEHEDDMEVVGEAADGRTAVRLCEQLHPDIVLMDISMPDLNGIEATRQIVAAHPTTRVVVLSMHQDKRFVAQVLQAKAVGYLLKDCVSDELVRAMRVVASGQTYLSPAIAGTVVEDYLQGGSDDAPSAAPLTPREREVLQLIAEGSSTKQTALELGISAKTIETHRQRIMKKLDIFSIAELTKYAIREGLTTPEH